MGLIPIEGVIPPGGYHFQDKSGGAEVRIDGSSYANVAQNVLMYRMKNARPPGNALQEVYDYVCGNWRHLCREEMPRTVDMAGEPLSSRMLAWLSDFQSTAGADAGVDQNEANRRASICAGCPKNIQFHGCSTCGEHIRSQTFIYLRNRTTPGSERIHACDALAEPLKLTVWSAKLKPLVDGQRENVTDYCWRKAI